MFVRNLSFGALLLLALNTAFADHFVVTFQGEGSGSLAGVPFGPASFLITAVIDPDDRVELPQGFATEHLQASIVIGDLGEFSFITPTRTFVNTAFELVGFSRASGQDLILGPGNSAFSSWDLLTPIGPISASAELIQWLNPPVETSAGVLQFDFSATTVVFAVRIDDIFADRFEDPDL